VTFWLVRRWKRQDRTSPVVCRALPNCSSPSSKDHAIVLRSMVRSASAATTEQASRHHRAGGRRCRAGQYLIPKDKPFHLQDGDYIERVTISTVTRHRTTSWRSRAWSSGFYLVSSREVYRLQGVVINDKHIEVIVRQMLQKVRSPMRATASTSSATMSTASNWMTSTSA
jgi:hypothetical protein